MSEQKSKGSTTVSEDEEEAVEPVSDTSLSEETDDLLDEIDAALEENAEDFIKSYVQRGGQ